MTNLGLLGITCGHVVNNTKELRDGSVIDRLVSDDIDVAYVRLQVPEGDNWFNVVPLGIQAFTGVLGENVYKIGASAGLTIGTLSSLSCEFRCPTSRRVFRQCVEIKWCEASRFAFHGDSGSFYCLRRGDAFIPIGIHRISGEGNSYGCKFGNALEVLNADEYSFPNPPY